MSNLQRWILATAQAGNEPHERERFGNPSRNGPNRSILPFTHEDFMNSAISFHADESIITPRVEIDPVVLTIHFHEPGQHAMYAAMDVKIFGSLDQFLDLGYAIVDRVNKIKYPNGVITAAKEPIDFGESLEAGLPYVPFAINDAVEHDEAMASMPPGYDPDLAERL